MTLLTDAPAIGTSPPVLPDATHRATDLDVEPRNMASVPPGGFCMRCGGLLVSSYTASWERDVMDKPMTLWRCVNCGDCVDRDIIANRGKGSGSARVRARPPAGPQYIEWLRGVGTGMLSHEERKSL